MKYKRIIIIVLLLLIGTIGTTIAYFNTRSIIDNNIKSEEYKVTYNYEYIKDGNWNPGDISNPSITVKNDGRVPIAVRAKITDEWTDKNGNNLALELYNGEQVAVHTINTNWFKEGDYYYYYKTINKEESTDSIINTLIYNSNTNKNVNCTNVDDSTTCTTNNDYASATYKMNITFETVQANAIDKYWNISLSSPKLLKEYIYQQSIYDDMISPTVPNDTGIKLPEISSNTNGNGVFTYKNNYTYYRGNVDNNIIFAGHCWNVVNITSYGIKLIYNGVANNNTCNNENENRGIALAPFNTVDTDMKYTGYMYKTYTDDDTDSNAKKIIDEWYLNNLVKYQNDIVDNIYICERDGEQGFNFPFAYVGRIRIWGNNNYGHAVNVPNTTIRLGTTIKEDMFSVGSIGNGKLKYPIALLTTDEAVLAGLRGYISENDQGTNSDNYLTSGKLFWLMNPAEKYVHSATMTYVNENGSLGGSLSTTSTEMLKPIITLRSDIRYKSGTGTKNNPLIISE